MRTTQKEKVTKSKKSKKLKYSGKQNWTGGRFTPYTKKDYKERHKFDGANLTEFALRAQNKWKAVKE